MSAAIVHSSVGSAPDVTGVRVGTSGWAYPHWRGRFYPSGLRQAEWLPYLATRLDTVEVNSTFYRLPTRSTIERWREAVPDDFRFAVKGSRLITHARRLDAPAALDVFLGRVEPLGPRLAVVLWQLPPSFERDLPRLDAFLSSLPDWVRHAVEFRHPSWRAGDVYALLERHGAANVAASTADGEPDLTVTGGLAYVRFHGLGGGYAHDYTEDEFEPWARFLTTVGAGFAFFNNDGNANAPRNAAAFRELLRREALPADTPPAVAEGAFR